MFIKTLRLITLVTFLSAPTAFPGDRQGNGGDDVRAAFFRAGGAVIKYLTNSNDGRNLVSVYRLDVKALEGTLTIQVVSVTENALFDSRGNSVDALAEPGSIRLRKKPWFDAFTAGSDLYSRVFHLMLEAAGHRDGDFRISEEVNPFPELYKVSTRIVVSPATSVLPYGERLAYLTKRGQLLAVRLATFGRADLLEELAIPRRRLLYECLPRIPADEEGRWNAVLTEIEQSMNAIEAKLP